MTSVLDPRTGQVERDLRPASDAELDALAARLRAGQLAWSALGPEGRAAQLLQFADALEAARDDLVAALTRDTGRAIESRIEADQVAALARRWAGAAPALLAPHTRAASALPGLSLETSAVPYSLVGVVSPWNFPLLLGLIDAVPALAAGCAVIVKPSEVTPRFAEPLAAVIATVPVLADVLAVVEGGGDVGAAVVDRVDAVCFTGSVPTGRLVARAAVERFIPAFLELGGKDPAIVLPGADLDRASSALLWGGTSNAGQSCLSIERVYVHESQHDELVDLLCAKAERLRLAHPRPESGTVGPLIDAEQATVIRRHLDDAVARGALVRSGGTVERHDGGHWVRPTILTDVDHSMAVMTEETFGPVLPVMAYSDVDHAVALANDSTYGLTAAVFGPDPEAAAAVARRLRVGAVSVNDAGLTAFVYEGEKNSFGFSGLGASRMGDSALLRFVRRQTLIVNSSSAPDPWWVA